MNYSNPSTIKEGESNQIREQWFDELVAAIHSHKLQLETNIAPDNLKSFYTNAIEGNLLEVAKLNKTVTQKIFVSEMLVKFFTLIQDIELSKLAFDFNDSQLLVWVETKDDDEMAERTLFLAEAKVNAEYHESGFNLIVTTVEESDKLSIPNHYISYK